MSITLKLPKLKLPSKKILLIAAASLVLLTLFTFGVVAQVRAERVEKAARMAEIAQLNDLQAENASLKRQVSQLQSSSQFNASKADSVCSWVKSQQVRYRYAVPPLCR